LLVLVFLSLPLTKPIHAEDDFYYVKDKENIIETFDYYEDALDYFNEYASEYDNLLIYHNDALIKMEYGYVALGNGVIEYYSLNNNEKSFLDANYVAEAAYLDTYDNEDYVLAYLSGEYLKLDIDTVELLAYSNDLKTSVYEVKDGCLYHHYSDSLVKDYYTNYLLLDNDFSILNDGFYYSYDGIYYYNDYSLMVDDYRQDSRDNSLNVFDPYYNYYQYLPAHSLSEYDCSDLKSFIENSLNISSSINKYSDKNNDGCNDVVNHSLLYGLENDFAATQDIYGVNNTYNLAIAINESNYGKSLLAYKNNNLYLNSAYNSKISKEELRYSDVKDSVINFARYYINKLYSSYRLDNYHGTHFGNRCSGIGYEYSLDPYFGEKSTAIYLKIDNNLNNKDLNKYALLISKDSPISLYYDEELSDLAFSLNNNCSLSFVVLKECEDSYLVLSDSIFENNQIYNAENNMLYIDKDDVLTIVNEDKIQQIEFESISYDFNEGTYSLLDKVTCNILKGRTASLIKPNLDGYEFVDYNLTEDGMYLAQYKEIKQISLYSPFKYTVNRNDQLDLSNGKLKITYADETSEIISITSSMVSKLNSSELGYQNIVISYNGLNIDKEIEVVEKESDVYELMSLNELRKVDIDNLIDNDYAYRIECKNNDISVSGLTYALRKPLFDSIFGDTYYCIIGNGNKLNNEFLTMIEYYGLEVIDNIDISFKLNYSSIELQEDIVVSKTIEHNPYKAYGVYRIENDHITKVYSEWSDNEVSFRCDKSGQYVILSTDFNNEYHIDDVLENVRTDTNGFDNHLFIRESFMFAVLVLIDLIGAIYYIIKEKELENEWKDFRKLLPTVVSALEEKQKN